MTTETSRVEIPRVRSAVSVVIVLLIQDLPGVSVRRRSAGAPVQCRDGRAGARTLQALRALRLRGSRAPRADPRRLRLGSRALRRARLPGQAQVPEVLGGRDDAAGIQGIWGAPRRCGGAGCRRRPRGDDLLADPEGGEGDRHRPLPDRGRMVGGGLGRGHAERSGALLGRPVEPRPPRRQAHERARAGVRGRVLRRSLLLQLDRALWRVRGDQASRGGDLPGAAPGRGRWALDRVSARWARDGLARAASIRRAGAAGPAPRRPVVGPGDSARHDDLGGGVEPAGPDGGCPRRHRGGDPRLEPVPAHRAPRRRVPVDERAPGADQVASAGRRVEAARPSTPAQATPVAEAVGARACLAQGEATRPLWR